ncbi:MAG: hypothetical protein RL291_852, partial [Pseudomonadota bacterium]
TRGLNIELASYDKRLTEAAKAIGVPLRKL